MKQRGVRERKRERDGRDPSSLLLSPHTSQSPSALYASYASHLASWGYAVLQYDAASIINLTPDAAEVGFLAPVWAWAVGAAAAAGAPLAADSLLVAGHSWGGKLAALHFCASPDSPPRQPPQPPPRAPPPHPPPFLLKRPNEIILRVSWAR